VQHVINIFCLLVSSCILFTNVLFAQVQTLSRIGQTPGGAASSVNYDSTSQRLFVGCGTSLYVYNMTNPLQPVILAKRPFLGLINESILKDSIIFIAATHDGVYACNALSDSLDILAHYDVTGTGDIGAYDLCLMGDTLLIADKFRARRIRFIPGTGFVNAGSTFSPWGTSAIAQKGNFIVTGLKGGGIINIYNKNKCFGNRFT